MPTLDFKGKHYVYAHHLSVPFRTLSVDVEKSLSDAPNLDDNLIIHGDNLHGLKALLPQYAGKIKCIYIDPPYNTGNEGWCYNDKVNSPLIREWLKKEANPVDKEDMERHDKWLCMMWPRLTLLRELLADDGVIFISIDDNEVHHLRCLMDEIFGEGNFVAQFVWNGKSGSEDSEQVRNNHEYLLCYSKIYENIHIGLAIKEGDSFPYFDIEKKQFYKRSLLRKWGDNSRREDRPNLFYPIKTQDNQMFYPKLPNGSDGCWRWGKEKMELSIKQGLVEFVKNRSGDLEAYEKIFDSDDLKKTKKHKTLILDGSSTANGTKECKSLFEHTKVFDRPKPSDYLRLILNMGDVKDSDLVLDSFAGSGTTAHAVLALNQEDGGNRKFILIECEDYADTITAERVRRVIRGVPTAKDAALKNGLGGSFTYCTLGGDMDIENILSGEHLPDYNALSQYVFYTATGRSLPRTITPQPDFFVGETDVYAVYVIYRPDLGYLRSNQSALNDEKVDIIQAHPSQKKKLVFATAKFMSGEDLKDRNITFCQIPYAIHNFVGA